MLAASVVAGECRGRPSASAFTESGDKVFCGDPLEQGYQKCVDQMELFALASLIPAVLALVLMVAAFTTPVLRTRPGSACANPRLLPGGLDDCGGNRADGVAPRYLAQWRFLALRCGLATRPARAVRGLGRLRPC